MHIARVGAEGKFVEHWANVDQLGMLMVLACAISSLFEHFHQASKQYN